MKTNLKKLLALVLALAMVAALFVGCQDTKKPEETKNSAVDTTGAKTDTQAPDVSNETDAPETVSIQ